MRVFYRAELLKTRSGEDLPVRRPSHRSLYIQKT
jgi:hypothetical protein